MPNGHRSHCQLLLWRRTTSDGGGRSGRATTEVDLLAGLATPPAPNAGSLPTTIHPRAVDLPGRRCGVGGAPVRLDESVTVFGAAIIHAPRSAGWPADAPPAIGLMGVAGAFAVRVNGADVDQPVLCVGRASPWRDRRNHARIGVWPWAAATTKSSPRYSAATSSLTSAALAFELPGVLRTGSSTSVSGEVIDASRPSI